MHNYYLKELMKFKYGKSQYKVEQPNGVYDIYGSAGKISKSNKYLYDKPSVLIGRKGTLNNPIYADKPFWCIDTMFYSIINTKIVSPYFLYYVFKCIDFNRYNESTGVPSLRVPTLESIKVKIPNLNTQLRITNISELLHY